LRIIYQIVRDMLYDLHVHMLEYNPSQFGYLNWGGGSGLPSLILNLY